MVGGLKSVVHQLWCRVRKVEVVCNSSVPGLEAADIFDDKPHVISDHVPHMVPCLQE